MMWEPQFPGHPSKLKIRNANTTNATFATKLLHGAKAAAGRDDRKLEYVLPSCRWGNVSFRLENPSLVAIALGFGGGYFAFHSYSGKVRVFLDGRAINATADARMAA